MRFEVIGIGEILWDLLPAGPQMGGAPANFAYHANALGACAQVITRIGKDDLGQKILNRFNEIGLGADLVQTDAIAPTGTASVTLNASGIPQFAIQENVAWDNLTASADALQRMRTVDAICFGSLAQRAQPSRDSIQQLVRAAPASSLRLFDINLRQGYYSREVLILSLEIANALKLNEDELPILAKILELGQTPEEQISQLSARFGLRVVALTRGASGSLLYQQGRWSQQPGRSVQVVDTVGAGDAFSATLIIGLLSRMDLDEVHVTASEVAAYVCSCAGATPPLPERFRRKFCT
jgi:fructokinase